jgi:L-alanine-DL-glutamate epimerase-like enolase superfamily enzyme
VSSGSAPAITEVSAWSCRFPLPRPFTLGRATLTHRDYVVVRVRTSDGLQGAAFSLTRGAPLDAVVCELIAPPILGLGAGDIGALHEAWAAALPHHAPEGLVLRAQSLVDIAAWDIAGQAAGEPVWRLLGAGRESAPVMLVEGYAITGEDDERFARRVAAAAGEGYAMVKLANLAGEADRMTRRLQRVRELAGDDVGLVVDVGFAWPDHDEAVTVARGWRDLALRWIEDPVHGHDLERAARLREAIDVPLGVGDEVTSRRTAAALVEDGAVDVLRADATCVGGITGLLAACRLAHARGIPVSTHIYPEIHRHVVLADPAGGPVEAFRPDTPFDTPQAFSAPPAVELDRETGARVVRAPQEPGLGLTVDWEQVERHSSRRLTASR